jgi:hypothetical protein
MHVSVKLGDSFFDSGEVADLTRAVENWLRDLHARVRKGEVLDETECLTVDW